MADISQRVFFAPDVVLQVIDGEALMLKLQEETAFSLNETGTRIAQLIDEGQPLNTLVDILSDEYQKDRSEVEDEVKHLVEALVSRGLVVFDRPGRTE